MSAVPCTTRLEHVNDLPPDLPRLRTLETWLVVSLERVRQQIAAAEQREAERQQGAKRRPPPPDWVLELGIGVGAPPSEVHAGDCYAIGRMTAPHHPRASPRSARRRRPGLRPLPPRHSARRAVTGPAAHAGGMSAPIVIHRPSPTGGRMSHHPRTDRRAGPRRPRRHGVSAAGRAARRRDAPRPARMGGMARRAGAPVRGGVTSPRSRALPQHDDSRRSLRSPGRQGRGLHTAPHPRGRAGCSAGTGRLGRAHTCERARDAASDGPALPGTGGRGADVPQASRGEPGGAAGPARNGGSGQGLSGRSCLGGELRPRDQRCIRSGHGARGVARICASQYVAA